MKKKKQDLKVKTISLKKRFVNSLISISKWGHHGRDRMVVGFTTTYAISTYHH